MPDGRILRFETLAPRVVHWGIDGWHDVQDVLAVDTGLGIYVADLDTKVLPAGTGIDFTFYWLRRAMGRHRLSRAHRRIRAGGTNRRISESAGPHARPLTVFSSLG